MKLSYTIFVLGLSSIACNDSIKYPYGGYDYPKHVADKDTNFYYYPVKDIMPKLDSLRYSVAYLNLKQFNEPNLSLRYLNQDIFRLQYSAPLGGFYIITVTKNSIQIKKPIPNDELFFDENRLSQTEQQIYRIISYNYPYNNLRGYKKRLVDSLKIANPKLLQPEYFLHLTKKAFKYIDPEKAYAITSIKITVNDFRHIAETINKLGYWKMPYVFSCKNYPMDGYSCILEANTKYKYNFVSITSCEDSSEQRNNFLKAGQEIINYAHLENEFFLWKDENMTDITSNNVVIPDMQLEDIKPTLSKHKKKTNLHNKHHK